LPKAGRLGIFMDKSDNNAVIVSEFTEKSPANEAGAKLKDRIISIDDEHIQYMSDVKYALLDKKPGDTVKLKLKRDAWIGDDKEISIEVKLN
jgi:C-terminal processing protease CtpA/Prc